MDRNVMYIHFGSRKITVTVQVYSHGSGARIAGVMAISKEDLAVLMEAAVKAAMAAVDGSREKSSRLDERHFRRVEKFDGAEGKWKEWSFLFKT